MIQIDVATIPTDIAADARVRVGSNRASGLACTRTMALAIANGNLIRTQDADDQLVAGALRRDVVALTQHPGVGWTASSAMDLWDGVLTRWEKGDPPSGPLPVRYVLESWESTRWDHLTILPSTMCIRFDLLIALGGWMGLPTSEDAGLLASASALAMGWFRSEQLTLISSMINNSQPQPNMNPSAAAQRTNPIRARVHVLECARTYDNHPTRSQLEHHG